MKIGLKSHVYTCTTLYEYEMWDTHIHVYLVYGIYQVYTGVSFIKALLVWEIGRKPIRPATTHETSVEFRYIWYSKFDIIRSVRYRGCTVPIGYPHVYHGA